MLLERYGHIEISELFDFADSFNPFPRYEDRIAWDKVSVASKDYWISLADKYIDYTWPTLKMELYMNFVRTGNISEFLEAHWERRSVLGTMVLAECLEGRGRFLDQIVNGIFGICEETSWMQPISNTKMNEKSECVPDASDHVVELAASETAALLTWTYYLFKDRFAEISSRINERIEREVSTRVLTPFIEHDDYWWHGFKGDRVNNWNPWCNANVLMGFLVFKQDKRTRQLGIKKIMQSLDVFINTYSPDGCCDEGPMYWGRSGGSLYDCLELMYLASSSKVDLFHEAIVQDIGRYIYKVHIHNEYFVDFADGDPCVRIPADVVFGYGKHIEDDNLVRLGASSPRYWGGITNWFPLYRYLRDIFQEPERQKYACNAPYVRDSWMDHAQVMTAREREGGKEGLYVAAKGGHNLESHNHNDVGNFIVYADGLPVIIDLGTEEYTAKTFSPQRFELWYLQSAYHNLPTVNGVMQHDGKGYRAKDAIYRKTDDLVELSLDISEAYPKDSCIADWRRTVRMIRRNEAAVEIEDNYNLSCQVKEIYFSLMTVCEFTLLDNGLFSLEYAPNKHVIVSYNPELLDIKCEEIRLSDRRLSRYWGHRVYRIVLVLKQPQNKEHIKLVIKKAE